MENEIMNTVMDEVMENNEEIVTEVCTCNNGTGKGVAIGVGIAAAGYGIYKLGQKLYNDYKAKKAAKVEVPEDITQDEIDDLPV